MSIDERMRLVGPFWTVEHTRDALGIHGLAPLGIDAGGRVLVLTADDGRMIVPVFQFGKVDGHLSTLPGLPELIRQLTMTLDPWRVAVLMRTPAPELDGHTPEQWAKLLQSPERLMMIANRHWG